MPAPEQTLSIKEMFLQAHPLCSAYHPVSRKTLPLAPQSSVDAKIDVSGPHSQSTFPLVSVHQALEVVRRKKDQIPAAVHLQT